MPIDEKNPPGTKGGKGGKVSVLQPYSVGQAAANLAVGQTELMVTPTEKLTHLDGEVTDNVTTTTTQGLDGKGGSYSDVTESSVAIKAKWLSRNPWLKFPGLIRRGEEVQIWRVGDTDQYYYELMGTSNHLRRKDIMLLVFSNTRDEATEDLTAANSVFFTIDTVDKHISLSTPINDGELASYLLQLNYGASNFSLSDNKGNAFLLDTAKALWMLKNSANSLIKMAGAEIDIEASKRVSIKTKLFDVNAENLNMVGKTSNITYTQQTLTGSVLALAYKTSTGGSGGGTFTFNGSSVDFDVGTVKHNGKTIDSTHKHNNVQSGPSNTGPVV